MNSASLPLFVFGTLRRGHENHHYLDGFYDRMIPAVLPGYVRVASLMIDRRNGAEVTGELYFLTASRYEKTLAGCDELEEIPPGTLIGHEYERRLVRVFAGDTAYDAWAYVRPSSSSPPV